MSLALSSTFADSTSSGGPCLNRKYILAQFRNDANFEWVDRLRTELVVDELKYKVVHEKRYRLQQNNDLWRRIQNGIGQATIIVIDPEPTIQLICENAQKEGMTKQDGLDVKWLTEKSAKAIVKNTPIANFPVNLLGAMDITSNEEVCNIEDFAPDSILNKLGGGLNKAKIFAARAHALFDFKNLDSSIVTTKDIFSSPLSKLLLTEFLETVHYFDSENPKSVDIFNAAAEYLYQNFLQNNHNLSSIPQFNKPISEMDSRNRDELQAADVAAGWAREIYGLTGDTKTLAQMFERVWVNGMRIK